jgi:hypothetical protein
MQPEVRRLDISGPVSVGAEIGDANLAMNVVVMAAYACGRAGLTLSETSDVCRPVQDIAWRLAARGDQR